MITFRSSRWCVCAVRRSMTSSPTHEERTASSTRCEETSLVTVSDVKELCLSVKGFMLSVHNSRLAFRPGQWLDVHIPGVSTVGGYSITCAPHHLREDRTLSLAIQHSDHPPAHWMTTQCRVGDKLTVRVGGDFWYLPDPPPASDSPPDLLLVAGGLGINPLYSMLQHHVHLIQTLRLRGCATGAARLLYSARDESHLIFKEQIDQLCQDTGGLVSTHYFVTRANARPPTTTQRIVQSDVKEALAHLKLTRLQCYVCGPPPMIADIEQYLNDCRVPPCLVHTEKWW